MSAPPLHLPVKLVSRFAFSGPSTLAAQPVAGMVAEWMSDETPPDGQDLLARAPDLSPLLDWAPHVAAGRTPLETLVRAVAALARYLLNMERGDVRIAHASLQTDNRALIFVGAHDGQASLEALGLAWLVLDMARGGRPDRDLEALRGTLADFCRRCRRAHPDYMARILMLGARSRDIPHLPTPIPRLWQFGWGMHGRQFVEALSNGDGVLGHQLASNKIRSHALLRRLGFPVSDQRAATTVDEALVHAEDLGWPVVLKPANQGKGRGVTVGVTDEAGLRAAFESSRRASEGAVLVERHVPGSDYRLLVIEGRLLAAARREPAGVTGDGVRSVAALSEALNAARRNDPVQRRYLKPVKLDETALRHLAAQGLTPESVPVEGRTVTLRGNANVSSGGQAWNVLDRVHPDVEAMAVSIAASTGLRALGLDYITPDIGRSWHEAGGAVIEINAYPGLDVHVASGEDEAALGSAVLGDKPARIPLILVLGAASELRLVADRLASRFRQPDAPGLGLAFPGTTALGATRLTPSEDLFGRTASLLLNRQCRALVSGATVEEILEQGLPADRFTAAVLMGALPEGARARAGWALARRHADRHAVFASADEAEERIGELLETATSRPARPAPRRPVPSPAELPADVRALNDRRPGPGVTVFAPMRNEAWLLPHFLEHHRRLGVENFLLYDDGSEDGCREYALDQPDCTVYVSNRRFDERQPDGRRFHHLLREAIPESLGPGRWVLTADVDEFLILPDEFGGLAGFLDMLDARGHDCVFGTMVDAYPASLAERNRSTDLSPFDLMPYFDADRGFRRRAESTEPEKVFTGVRARLIAALKQAAPDVHAAIFGGRDYLMPALFKVPLVRTGRGIRRLNAHTIDRQPPFDVEVALAHFKLGPDLDSKIREALATRTHYLQSIEYAYLAEVTARFPGLDLRCARTRRFDAPGALAEAGMVVWTR